MRSVEPYTIEHWRDGELIATFALTPDMIERCDDGTGRITVPPGLIELDTADELRFDRYSLCELLR
jgi:hypothetical protein